MHPFPSCLQALPLSLRALLGSTALLSAIATSAPAAQAIGFLNLDSGSWTGALECPIPGESLNCVENITASTVTLVGPDTEGSFLIYISQPVPVGDPGYTIGFDYAFNSSPFRRHSIWWAASRLLWIQREVPSPPSIQSHSSLSNPSVSGLAIPILSKLPCLTSATSPPLLFPAPCPAGCRCRLPLEPAPAHAHQNRAS
jgi:hypothetical protein